MSSLPSVSVIIPAYNQAEFLGAAIESALGQDGVALEIVVVNDGSTDGTAEVVRSFAERGVKLVTQENRGLSGARNRGFAESQGEFVLFLDSDDMLAAGALQALSQELAAARPEVAFVYGDTTHIDRDGNTPADFSYSVGAVRDVLSGDIFESLLQGGYFPVHCALVRRSAIVAVGHFDESLRSHEDYDLWLRLMAAKWEARYLDRVVAIYRLYAGSMSTDQARMTDTRRAVLEKLAASHPERIVGALEARLSGGSIAGQVSLIDDVTKAELIAPDKNQAAIWDADINGVGGKAVLLHPPAELTFRLSDGAPGRFRGFVGMHPKCWDMPNSGGCSFAATVDGKASVKIDIDPKNNLADRNWHAFSFDVAASHGGHVVRLRTQAFGPGSAARWALWRDLRFIRAS